MSRLPDMFRLWLSLAVVLFICPAGAASASTLVRTADRWVALTNSALHLKAVFKSAETAAMNGFCYSEQIPDGLAVVDRGVKLNGQAFTNYAFVAGQDDDVEFGCIPYRWVLEEPPNFSASNGVPPSVSVEISYDLISTNAGAFWIPHYSWFGSVRSVSNSCFGFYQPGEQDMVGFVSTPPSAILAVTNSNGVLTVALSSLFGAGFVVEESTNLVEWRPCVTNFAPLEFLLPRELIAGAHFYRAVWVP